MSKLRVDEIESLATGKSILVDEIDSGVRADLANPDKGAAMVARGVVAVDSIADLLALPEGQRKKGLRYLVRGYHNGSDIGGGDFVWDSQRQKSEHDGGTVIDPDVSFPNDWSNDDLNRTWFFSSNPGEGCFVRGNYTTLCYSDFGAKLDGVHFDNREILRTHQACNRYDIDVKVTKRGAVIYFSVEAPVKTSIDFNMATLLCTDDNKSGRYIFYSDESFTEIPNLTKITADYESTFIPELAHLDTNVVVKISDTDAYSVRQDGPNTYPVYRKDILLHNFLGNFSTPVCYKYDQSHNVKVEYRKLDKPRGIYNLKVVSEMSRENFGGFTVYVRRDNFKIRDVIVDPTVESMIHTDAYKGSLFQCTDCINLSIKRVTGNNIAGFGADGIASGRAGYVFFLDTINGVYLSELVIRGAWGATGFHNIQKLYCYNSIITRIDLHLYGRDFVVRDSTLHDFSVGGSDLHGTLLVDNCTFMSRLRAYSGMLFMNAGTYGSFCPADLHFSNIKIINNTEAENRINLLHFVESTRDTEFKGEKKIGNIYLDNITINGTDAGYRDFYIMRTTFRRSTNVEIGEIVVNNINNNLSDNLYLLHENNNPFSNEVKFKVSNCVLNNYFTEDDIDFSTFFPTALPTPYIGASVIGSSLVSVDYYKVVGVIIYNNLNYINVDSSEVLLSTYSNALGRCRVINSVVHATPSATTVNQNYYPDLVQFVLPARGVYMNCEITARGQFLDESTRAFIGLTQDVEYVGCRIAFSLWSKANAYFSANPEAPGKLIFDLITSQDRLFNLPLRLAPQYLEYY